MGGRYEVEIVCADVGHRVQTTIDVASPKREKLGVPARKHVLREIAEISGGIAGQTETFGDILTKIGLLPERRPAERRLLLWCHPLWCAFIVFLLGSYWVNRKLLGMI
jgi:hypothetical protein